MTTDKISAIVSTLVAISILIASFFQWWDITYDGGMRTRSWVKVLFSICIVILIVSLCLILW